MGSGPAPKVGRSAEQLLGFFFVFLLVVCWCFLWFVGVFGGLLVFLVVCWCFWWFVGVFGSLLVVFLLVLPGFAQGFFGGFFGFSLGFS